MFLLLFTGRKNTCHGTCQRWIACWTNATCSTARPRMWWRASVSTTLTHVCVASTPPCSAKAATLHARLSILTTSPSARPAVCITCFWPKSWRASSPWATLPCADHLPWIQETPAATYLTPAWTTGWTHRSLSSSAMIRVILTSSFSMKRWAIQWLFEDHCTSGFLHKRPVRTFGQF